MSENKKLKIAYALRPVVIVDEDGKKMIRYEKFHPVTTGNAVIIDGKTLKNKLTEYYTKNEVDSIAEASGKVKSVNGQEGEVLITAAGIGALVPTDIEGKVDKVEGKGLSTEDFTTVLKEKLDSLNNYDDTSVRGLITGLQQAIDVLSGKENTTEAIDSVNEIIAFLETFKNDKTLANVLATMMEDMEQWVEEKGYAGAAELNGLKDELASVAKTGSYNDLSDKPTIPTVPGSLPANGGNADTVDNYHFVVGSIAGTDTNTIYFVV